MDMGHGLHNMNFDVASRVLDQGLFPDTLSTDGHRLCREGPVDDLPTTVAKLMAVGFSLPQVVHMATSRAASLLGHSEEMGALVVGRTADISILRLEDREWQAVDSQRGTIQARQALVPVLTIRNGMPYDPFPSQRP
jgi:dihydroorotase